MMSVRRLFAGVATTSVVAASLALASPAQADPTFVPVEADYVGVGSDTSMFALNYLADGKDGVPGYNAGKTTGRLASFDAGTSGTHVLREGSAPTNRSTFNGSGNGKKALFGPGNNTDVDFARSSSAINAAEKSAGLFAFPFAKDNLALATAKTSNAPANISPADMVKIYKGDVTNWSQVPGGASGVIVPMIPQPGSGTRSFFDGELKAANGGEAVTLAPSVVEVQEHDANPVKDNPNAVAPFSVGRNAVDGAPLRIETGFAAARALYNVVRQADVDNAGIAGIFGKDGFVCSTAARPLIEAAGFEQLARPDKGGVCGVPTQEATSNLEINAEVATTTTLAGESKAAGAATLTATVEAGSTPDGIVNFYEGATLVGTSPLTGGKATVTKTGLTPGNHSFVAKYMPPSASNFLASESAAVTVNVLATSTPSPSPTPTATASPQPQPEQAAVTAVSKFKKSYKMAKVIKGKIVLKESAAGAPTGKVVAKLGKKKVGSAKIKGGKITLKLKGLKKGKNKVVVTYKGNDSFKGFKLKLKITVK